jgi:hypothetical protein
MGLKITVDKMLEINKLLKRADKAINVLQRGNNNKIIYPELQRDIQRMIEELDSRYGLIEYNDVNAREKLLNKAKKQAEDDWKRRTTGV